MGVIRQVDVMGAYLGLSTIARAIEVDARSAHHDG
jgi:hypothetical protein